MNRISAVSSNRVRTAIRSAATTVQRSLTTLEGRSDHGSKADGGLRTIERVIADLDSLNRATERDFLAVGGKLMEFRSATRQISSDMATLTELISGERARKASQALTSMLERCREMNARSEQDGEALAGVRDLTSTIRRAFFGLRNTVSIFRTLCTQTRIETARLGDTSADFGDLAEVVRPLSDSIQSSGERVLDAGAELEKSVEAALRSGSELRDRQLRELPSLIANLVSGLQSLEERRRRAHEASVLQAAQNEAAGEALDNLVRSIQFHDITRQQIEHVVLALRQICSGGEGAGLNGRAPAPRARSVLALQCAQLSSAERVFASSVARMESDLESISARVRDMAEASRALLGVPGGEQEPFFLKMESSLAAILQGVGSCSTAESEIRARAHGLGQTIAEMRESVGEIRRIEGEIRRIVMNATIQAAHLGAAGNTLDVIAGIMHRLVLASSGNTEDAAAALDSMAEITDRMSGDAITSDQHSGAGEVAGQILATMRELHSSSESSSELIGRIVALGSRLGDDLDSVRGNFSAGRLFAEVATGARRELERIAAETRTASPRSIEAAPAQALEGLADNYTMQMERDIHDSLTGVAAISSPAAVEQRGVAPEEGNLGDNVELF